MIGHLELNSTNIRNREEAVRGSQYSPRLLRGVPTEGRKPCDCKYRRIERVHRSVGTLLCCDRGHSSKIVSKMVFFGFRLNSNMFNISFSMSIFSYQNKSKSPVGTPIFDVFR